MNKNIVSFKNKTYIGNNEIKTLKLLAFLELCFIIYSFFKGTGIFFIQIAIVLVPMSLLGCMAVFRFGGDKYLLIVVILLLNFGFLIQMMSQDNISGIYFSAMIKCLSSFLIALIASILFKKFSNIISMDIMIYVLTAIQSLFIIVLYVWGITVGNMEGAGAKINIDFGLFVFQPLEVVKVIYVFVSSIIFCKEERVYDKIMFMPRELYFVLYNFLISLAMIKFSEFGTLLIMALTGFIMMIIYSTNRKTVKLFSVVMPVLTVLGVIAIIFINPTQGWLGKLYGRFRYFLTPEVDYMNTGYHGVQIRKALTVGGLLGPDSNRYIVNIPNSESDMVFSNLIQHCGIIMGILLIFTFIILLVRGIEIARKCIDSYFSGLAMGFTLLIVIESIIHIGYNIGILPITGIPLYGVSQGFTATTTYMIMIAIILTISTETTERSSYDEKVFEKNMGKTFKGFLPGRRKFKTKNQY